MEPTSDLSVEMHTPLNSRQWMAMLFRNASVQCAAVAELLETGSDRVPVEDTLDIIGKIVSDLRRAR